jgi:hypothetical protein
MQLMLCIEGTERTNTVTGQVYSCVRRFVCPHCGYPSPILEFDSPVALWYSNSCEACLGITRRPARYGHRDRFIPLNDPDAEMEDVVAGQEVLEAA